MSAKKKKQTDVCTCVVTHLHVEDRYHTTPYHVLLWVKGLICVSEPGTLESDSGFCSPRFPFYPLWPSCLLCFSHSQLCSLKPTSEGRPEGRWASREGSEDEYSKEDWVVLPQASTNDFCIYWLIYFSWTPNRSSSTFVHTFWFPFRVWICMFHFL